MKLVHEFEHLRVFSRPSNDLVVIEISNIAPEDMADGIRMLGIWKERKPRHLLTPDLSKRLLTYIQIYQDTMRRHLRSCIELKYQVVIASKRS